MNMNASKAGALSERKSGRRLRFDIVSVSRLLPSPANSAAVSRAMRSALVRERSVAFPVPQPLALHHLQFQYRGFAFRKDARKITRFFIKVA